jgi:hypothetical protein
VGDALTLYVAKGDIVSAARWTAWLDAADAAPASASASFSAHPL